MKLGVIATVFNEADFLHQSISSYINEVDEIALVERSLSRTN